VRAECAFWRSASGGHVVRVRMGWDSREAGAKEKRAVAHAPAAGGGTGAKRRRKGDARARRGGHGAAAARGRVPSHLRTWPWSLLLSFNMWRGNESKKERIAQVLYSLHETWEMGRRACKWQKVFQPGFEPGTSCVLSRRHNQLDHRNLVREFLEFSF